MPTPVIQPVGLHYRDRARFRTDLWIEFGDPFEVDSHMLPESFHEAIASGSWEEPPLAKRFWSSGIGLSMFLRP